MISNPFRNEYNYNCPFGFVKFFTEMDLYSIHKLIDYMEVKLNEHDREWDYYAKIYNQQDVNSKDRNLAEDLVIKAGFKSITSGSLLVTIYSIFENFLNRLCIAYIRSDDEDFETSSYINNTKDKGIFKAINYLKEKPSFQDVERDSDWRKIKSWRYVRNCLVHEHGKVYISWQKIKIKKLGVTILNDDNSLMIDIEDCRSFLQLIYKFYDKYCSK